MAGLTRRDQVLLDLAADGMSGEEMGARLNLPAAQCVLRVQEILRDKDMWSDIERRQLLLHDLYRLKSALQKQVEDTGLDPKDVGNLLKTLSTMATILDNASKITSDQLTQLSSLQAKILFQLVVASFGRAKKLLAEEYPDVDILRIDDAFEEGLREEAVKVLEA